MLRIFSPEKSNGFSRVWTRKLGYQRPAWNTLYVPSSWAPMKTEQSVLKCWHIKFRRRGITQKKAYMYGITMRV
jgi:hypothetical protein